MKEYLSNILEGKEKLGCEIYEPPNNVPILRYKVFKQGYNVIVVGEGDLVDSCIRWLKTEKIYPICVVSDNYISDEVIVVKFAELEKIIGNKKIYAVIVDDMFMEIIRRKEIINNLYKYNITDYIYPYEYEKIPKHNSEFLTYFKQRKEDILDMLDILEDTESIMSYCEYIRAIDNLDFYRLEQLPTYNKYFDKKIFKPLEDECFINCGSSNGDSIFYFLENYENFEKIYAIEPDKKRMRSFKQNKCIIPEVEQQKIEELNITIGDDVREHSLDYIFKDKKVTLINMDIEGFELNALKSAEKIIKTQKPVLAICAYHLPTDLVDMPLYIKSLSEEYHIFYRKYASTFRNKFRIAELVMYAVPEHRLIKGVE